MNHRKWLEREEAVCTYHLDGSGWSSRCSTASRDTSIFIDEPGMDVNDRLKGAGAGVDALISRGAHILQDLAEQEETMKRIQRRMLDIGQRLGLSQTIMRMIEQRSTQDMYLFFAGTIISTALMIAYTPDINEQELREFVGEVTRSSVIHK
eukprot:gene517-3842_t